MKKIILILLCFLLYLASTVPVGLFLYSMKTNSDLDVFKKTGFHGYLSCLKSEGAKVLNEVSTSNKKPVQQSTPAIGDKKAITLYQTARGYEEKKMYSEAASKYSESAQLGYPQAYLALSDLHALGHGVEKDIGKSMHYLKMAADAGSDVAQFNYANKLRDNHEKKEDLLTASYYYDMAAQNGITFSGIYLERNKTQCLANKSPIGSETVSACLLGAYAKNGAIENMVSNMYRDGNVLTKNPKESQAWAVKSADHKNFPAIMTVINNYLDGYGTEPDVQKAYFYYKKFFKHSSTQEQAELQDLYNQRLSKEINPLEKAWSDTQLFLASLTRKGDI